MKKILLVDDSTMSRNIIKRILGDSYEFVEAGDGVSALEKYFLEKPDLVILDLTMPGMNGAEVLEKLRQLDPQSKIIIGTADVQELTRQEMMQHGALDYVVKPFREEELRTAVARTLQSVEESR